MVWLSSQIGGTERVHIVTKGSCPKEKPPLRDVGLTPSSSFSSNILCPQGARITFIIFHFPSSLPVLSYPLSLSSPHFLSLLLPFPHTFLSPPYFPHPYPSPKSSDAELGLKKSHFAELMALWELLFEYYLIQLQTEKYLQVMLGDSWPGIWLTKWYLSWALGKANGRLGGAVNWLACLKP